MENYNRVYFSKADVENGLHLRFIEFLLANFETDEYRVDIHVYTEDCKAVVVEFVRQLWRYVDDMGKFVFLDGDEEVMKEVILPDNTITYAHTEEEAEEVIKEWNKAQRKLKREE